MFHMALTRVFFQGDVTFTYGKLTTDTNHFKEAKGLDMGKRNDYQGCDLGAGKRSGPLDTSIRNPGSVLKTYSPAVPARTWRTI